MNQFIVIHILYSWMISHLVSDLFHHQGRFLLTSVATMMVKKMLLVG